MLLGLVMNVVSEEVLVMLSAPNMISLTHSRLAGLEA